MDIGQFVLYYTKILLVKFRSPLMFECPANESEYDDTLVRFT
jgi:hypothetical protein